MTRGPRLLGHPIHPMLVVLPLALLPVAVGFDALYLASGNADFALFAFFAITVGLLGGLAAALFGVIDWLAVRPGTRARRIGAWHGLGNAAVILLFVVSWALRLQEPAYAPSVLPFALGLIGVGIIMVTAWLGGELVYRLGIGVDEAAHADAPSSLGGSVPEATEVASGRREPGRPARQG